MGLSKAQAENSGYNLEMVPFEVNRDDEVNIVHEEIFWLRITLCEIDVMKCAKESRTTYVRTVLRIYNMFQEANYNSTCDVAKSDSFSAIIDLTWGGWDDFKMEAEKNGMPYIRFEAANHQFVKVDKKITRYS